MVGIFRQKTPANVLILFVFALLVKMPIFYDPYVPVIHPKDGIVYHAILRWLQSVSPGFPMIFPLLAFICLLIQAFWLNGMINEQRLLPRSNYLPAMSYLLITSLLPEWNYFSAPLLVNFSLLMVLYMTFKLYHQNTGKSTIFNLGLAMNSFIFIFPISGFSINGPFCFNDHAAFPF